MYDLYAVTVHVGNSLNQGHYMAFTKSDDSQWYKCNDNIVTNLSKAGNDVLDTIITEDGDPYTLFFTKKNYISMMPLLRPPMNSVFHQYETSAELP